MTNSTETTETAPLAVDALLVLSFGGPEGPADVLPFLRNVTRGRNVPDERLAEVAEQYNRFGGRSPINDHGRSLVEALRRELAAHGHDLPVYFGNRNWHPFLADTVATMADDGIKHAAVFVTSAFGSYSGCRQYREDLEAARAEVGPSAPRLDKLRLYYNHPGFLRPQAARLAEALNGRPDANVVFTAHSLPVSMAQGCDYQTQLLDAATTVMAEAGAADRPWSMAYQSRSGPPHVPWLEPDINDHLTDLAADGVTDVAVVPIGFVSDHMEVLFDLDTQAAETATKLGIGFTRVPTVGLDPEFVTMVRLLVEERYGQPPATPVALGDNQPWPDQCPVDHCPPPARSGAGRPGKPTSTS